jgi:preprotein translocase subunit YajC
VPITTALAQATPPVKTGDMASLLNGPIWMFALMFAVMYFLMIRPQQKKAKEQRQMMDALGKGDEVVTAGGILGKVTKVNDTYVTVEVSANTEIVVQKNAITTLLPKGTLKSL